ncbi:MAG: acetolactate decarboxylase [Bacteroidetes bacterium]|nr:acetolactate decarboxylase [Bacteroidota bacterium]
MKQIYILAGVLIILLSSCKTDPEVNVKYSGALMEIMAGNIAGTISLDTLKDMENVYALGTLEDLKGEIQIFKGEVVNSSVSDSTVLLSSSLNNNASLLVYTSVKHWEEVEIPSQFTTEAEVEKFVFDTAKEKGISVEKPFPFLLTGRTQSLSWHIINWDVNDKEHTHKKHQLSGLNGIINDTAVEILGFYSDKHKGVFTHHTTNMHLHFKTQNNKLAGHVDDLVPGEKMILKLPKQ